ncbi:hypothetical protein BH11ARM2_BH11ARM2_23150 [soil metagenome]
MQSELPRTPANREAANLALARHTAFASLFAAVVALVVALALDFTTLVPLIEGQDVYNPIRDFLSYQVDAGSGQIMTGVFLLLAVAAWSYAAAAYLAPARHTNRVTLTATLLFGSGLFVGACFRAVPNAEIAVAGWLKEVAILHNVGIGGGFIPAMFAAFIDQRKIVFGKVPGFFLTKLSFWLIVGGAVGTGIAVLVIHSVAGLMQRCFVMGVVLWLATEAHQLFWSSGEEARASATMLDD